MLSQRRSEIIQPCARNGFIMSSGMATKNHFSRLRVNKPTRGDGVSHFSSVVDGWPSAFITLWGQLTARESEPFVSYRTLSQTLRIRLLEIQQRAKAYVARPSSFTTHSTALRTLLDENPPIVCLSRVGYYQHSQDGSPQDLSFLNTKTWKDLHSRT